jgi:tRNA 2-thiocytidine biosynthesis protein TtcA
MKKTQNKLILARVKKAIARYQMIEEGDKIAVGTSGGKDSGALLYIMSQLRLHLPRTFSLHAIFVDMGWPDNLQLLAKHCQQLQVPLHIEKTLIAKVVFERRKEKNPCSLCAKLRRGALHQAALKLGCNKVALGHHLDDAIQTFFLNLIFTGQFNTFKPRTFLSKSGLHLIRPMIYLSQKSILLLHRTQSIPNLENPCPVANKTKRAEIKILIDTLLRSYPDLHQRFITALENLKPEEFWYPEPKRKHQSQNRRQ